MGRKNNRYARTRKTIKMEKLKAEPKWECLNVEKECLLSLKWIYYAKGHNS